MRMSSQDSATMDRLKRAHKNKLSAQRSRSKIRDPKAYWIRRISCKSLDCHAILMQEGRDGRDGSVCCRCVFSCWTLSRTATRVYLGLPLTAYFPFPFHCMWVSSVSTSLQTSRAPQRDMYSPPKRQCQPEIRSSLAKSDHDSINPSHLFKMSTSHKIAPLKYPSSLKMASAILPSPPSLPDNPKSGKP